MIVFFFETATYNNNNNNNNYIIIFKVWFVNYLIQIFKGTNFLDIRILKKIFLSKIKYKKDSKLLYKLYKN